MLARMEAQDEEFEARLRALEGWRDCGRGGGDAWWGVKEIVRVLGGG